MEMRTLGWLALLATGCNLWGGSTTDRFEALLWETEGDPAAEVRALLEASTGEDRALADPATARLVARIDAALTAADRVPADDGARRWRHLSIAKANPKLIDRRRILPLLQRDPPEEERAYGQACAQLLPVLTAPKLPERVAALLPADRDALEQRCDAWVRGLEAERALIDEVDALLLADQAPWTVSVDLHGATNADCVAKIDDAVGVLELDGSRVVTLTGAPERVRTVTGSCGDRPALPLAQPFPKPARVTIPWLDSGPTLVLDDLPAGTLHLEGGESPSRWRTVLEPTASGRYRLPPLPPGSYRLWVGQDARRPSLEAQARETPGVVRARPLGDGIVAYLVLEAYTSEGELRGPAEE